MANTIAINVPIYLADFIRKQIEQAESKLGELQFHLAEEDLPNTTEETNDVIMQIRDKIVKIHSGKMNEEYNGLEDLVESARLNLLKHKEWFMEKLVLLEKPLHSSWSNDLKVMETFIFTEEPPTQVWNTGNYEYDNEEDKDEYENYGNDDEDSNATIKLNHPYYNLAQDLNGEIDIKASAKFISESFESAIDDGEDMNTMYNSFIEVLEKTGFVFNIENKTDLIPEWLRKDLLKYYVEKY